MAGEAKRKRRAHAAILERFPFCIYCGATAKTIEHMPPIQMFRLRDRPKGLEFPSCLECNNGTGDSDLVASLLGRTYPDAKLEHGRSELIKLLEAVGNNVPGLLQEMQVEAGGQKLARRSIPNMPPHTAVLRADGPILQHHMLTFGAKLGFALHFEFFGTRVRDDGGVQPFYYTNVSAARGELPLGVIDFLPDRRTLKQGIKHVSDQFTYSCATTEEKRHAVFYAVFNGAFAIMAISAFDRTEFLDAHANDRPVFAPGAFRR